MLSEQTSELAPAAALLPLTIEGQQAVARLGVQDVALLSVAECASRLNVSESWVRRHPDVLRPIRLDGNVRYDAEFIETLCTSSTSQFIVAHAGRPLKLEGTQMLQRWQCGSVYKYRGKKVTSWYGIYRIDKRDADGIIVRQQKSVKLGTLTELPTKSAAKAKLRSLLEVANQKQTVTLTFRDLVERWQRVVAITLHDSTRNYYEKMLKAHLIPILGDREIAAMTLRSFPQLRDMRQLA